MAVITKQAGLSAARKRITYVARQLRFSAEETEALLLAVGEAVTNAYVHGTPEPGAGLIYLGWQCEGDTLIVTIRDEGLGKCDKGRVPLSEQRVIMLGCGIELMRSVMDEVDIRFERGTTVILKKRNRSLII
ncbi:MAG: ATP-binding protein [Armatimonadota bacterium]